MTAFALSISAVLLFSISSSDAENITIDDSMYSINGSCATLLVYFGDETRYTIPETIEYEGETYDVTGMDKYCIPSNLEELTISANIEDISVPFYSPGSHLSSIIVSSENRVFSVVNNVLFIGDDLHVVAYAPACTNAVVNIAFALSISEHAFHHAANIETVLLNPYLGTIREFTFEGCTKLKEITYFGAPDDGMNRLPNGIIMIDRYAFSECSSLEIITMSDSVRAIMAGAFYGCSSLKTVNLNSGLYLLGYGAFMKCCSLTDIVIEDNETYYVETEEPYKGILMRKDLSRQKYITVYPGGIDRESLTIDDDIMGIDGGAFAFGEGKLKTVIIEKYMSDVTSYAFYYCKSLETVIFKHPVTDIKENAFNECTSLRTVELGKELVYIDNYAFMSCSVLENITLPDTVKYIGEFAFSNTKINNVILGDKIEYLGLCAFSGAKLQDITINGRPEISDFALSTGGELTVHKHADYSIQDSAFGLSTTVIYDNFDEWKFPKYNVLGIIVCVLILFGMYMLFRKI